MQPYALITGASKGLGKSMALQLAAQKIPILLVARSEHALAALAQEIRNKYQVSCEFLAIDLSITNAPSQVLEWCQTKGYAVSILINNAGYGLWGRFDALSLDAQMDMLRLNMLSLTRFTHLFLPELKRHPQSYILNVASTAAYQAVPTLSLYAASKSFVLSFSRGLAFELKGSSVSLTCLCPGPVNTFFTERAGMTEAIKKTAEKFGMDAEAVARIGLKAMFAKKTEVIPGFTNQISAFFVPLFPKSLIERIAASVYK
jgi:uncharacterized protein